MGDFLGMGSKDASSQANTTTTSNNIDRRQVVAEGGFGVASDGATVNIQALDAGIVKEAISAVSGADAINGQGFTQLLNLADKVFTGAGAMIEKTQGTALAQVEALNTVANDAQGKIDQKTLVVMAAAGLAGAYLLKKKG